MRLTVTTTHAPATDLLAKHPARVQTFALGFGKAHVFYPEATAERCTATLVLGRGAFGVRQCVFGVLPWKASPSTRGSDRV